MNENDENPDIEDNYKVIFRSSFTEPDWFSAEEEGEFSPPQFAEFKAEGEGPDDKALLDIGKKLERMEEMISLKDREIAREREEIERLKEELEKSRSKPPEQSPLDLEMVREEVAREREEIVHIKESYDEKLSLLSEREFELNKMEEELSRKKEDLETTKTDTAEQDPRLQIDVILEKGKAMAAVNQNLQAYFFFRLAVYLHPHHATALNNLAISMYKLGFKDKARACLGKALELDPENEAARINLERMSKPQDA